MPVENPTIEDFFAESDRHDDEDASKLPENVKTRANQILADHS